jgi:hypothetical protein
MAQYTFLVTGATAQAGDTYSNNSATFTVVNPVSNAASLITTGSSAPTSSGTLTRVSGSGSATLTFTNSYLQTTYTLSPGTSVQTQINACNPGDKILLNAGNYNLDAYLVIPIPLTIAWASPSYVTYDGVTQYANTANQPVFNFNSDLPLPSYLSREYSYLMEVTTDNVTLQGLSMNNVAGGGYPYAEFFVGNNHTDLSSFTMQYCNLNSARQHWIGYNCTIHYTTITNCTFWDNMFTPLWIFEGDNWNISYNQFWRANSYISGDANGAILWQIGQYNSGPPGLVGTCKFSYNYMCNFMAGISIYMQQANLPASGSILINHNTIDMGMATSLLNPSTSVITKRGIDLSVGTGQDEEYGSTINGSLITIKDNIVTRCKAFGLFLGDQNGNALTSPMTLTSNLFYNNSWYSNANAPTAATTEKNGDLIYIHGVSPSQLLYQYPQPLYTNGDWGSGGANDMPGTGSNSLVDHSNVFYKDPLYTQNLTSPSGWSQSIPAQFYALQNGSPAANAASDGTNIGAWQGSVTSLTTEIQYVPANASLPNAWPNNWPLPLNK